MSRDDQHFRLRIPADLKRQIELAAEEDNRSINAEIVGRLVRSFGKDDRLDEATRAYREEIDRLQQTLQAELISANQRAVALAQELAKVQQDRDMYANDLNQLLHSRLSDHDRIDLPASLRDRIAVKAKHNGREVPEEALLALEEAFPPPPPFSLDDFFEEWARLIIGENDPHKKAELIARANAVLKENGDKYEVWLSERDGKPGFAFGSKGSRELEAASRKKREDWGKL